MKIYNYDHEGFYVGECDADESPLEPGVYLIPARATEVKPPKLKDGHQIKMVDGEWMNVPTPVEVVPEPVVRTDAEIVRANIRTLMFQIAKANGFDNMLDAVSFKDDDDETLSVIATKLYKWRSKVLVAMRTADVAALAAMSEEEFKVYWTKGETFNK